MTSNAKIARAMFASPCPRCTRPIRIGERIEIVAGRWVHSGCAPAAVTERVAITGGAVKGAAQPLESGAAHGG